MADSSDMKWITKINLRIHDTHGKVLKNDTLKGSALLYMICSSTSFLHFIQIYALRIWCFTRFYLLADILKYIRNSLYQI